VIGSVSSLITAPGYLGMVEKIFRCKQGHRMGKFSGYKIYKEKNNIRSISYNLNFPALNAFCSVCIGSSIVYSRHAYVTSLTLIINFDRANVRIRSHTSFPLKRKWS